MLMTIKRLTIIAILLLSLSLTADSYSAAPKFEFQKGMNYVTLSKDRYTSNNSDESLKTLSRTGTKWIGLVTTWYQQSCSSTDIFSSDKTPSDESIVHAIQTAHSLGMKIMLKPHVELLDTSGGSWRGEVACTKDDWGAWFDSYANFILHYAKLAEENKVEILCLGTELSSVSVIKENLWKDKVVKPVREVYKGPLTYAANWDEEYRDVKFWDSLDYVGIDAYFPLSDKERPTIEEIKSGWEPWLKDIEEFQAKVNKPIVFTETGYCSAPGTTKVPWEEVAHGEVDMQLQADCYKALLETFWNKPWFYGVYWWKWGTSVRLGGPNNRSFTPQNKTAQDVVKKWYNKSVPKKTYGKK